MYFTMKRKEGEEGRRRGKGKMRRLEEVCERKRRGEKAGKRKRR